MNLHVPQSLEAQAELRNLLAVQKNLISTQTGKPIICLHQDNLLACKLFTDPDQFFDANHVMDWMIEFPEFLQKCPPCILKPIPLWSGKQMLAYLLPKGYSYNYKEVFIDNSCFLTGTLTKEHVGTKGEGMMHIMWRYHGEQSCIDFLDNIQTVLRRFLTYNGFSVGISDCVQHGIDDAVKINVKSTNATFASESEAVIQLSNEMNEIGNIVQKSFSEKNRFKVMIAAGSKGSTTNITQIAGIVGQQLINGKRINEDLGDRTMSCFQKYDMTSAAKGYVSSNYIHGLNPTEFFFHAAGGREGLTDTAIKTSETGYLYRKLEKMAESISIRYDSTVRNCNDDIIQLRYGDDGFDPSYSVKSDIPITKYAITDAQLGEYSFDFEEISYWKTLLSKLAFPADQKATNEWITAVDIKGLFKRSFCCATPKNKKEEESSNCTRSYDFQVLYNTIEDQFQFQRDLNISLLFQIHLFFHLRIQQTKFLNQDELKLLVSEIHKRYEQSFAVPGEAVGGSAASACAAPTTQMALNVIFLESFHLAGTGSKITSGLKRITDLFNNSNPKMTTTKIFLHPLQDHNGENPSNDYLTRQIAKKIQCQTMIDITTSIQIKYDTEASLYSDYSWYKDFIEVYQQMPQSYKKDLNPYYMELVIDRKKILELDLTLSDIKSKVQECFADLRIFTSPNLHEKLVMLWYLPDDLNEDKVKQKVGQKVMDGYQFWRSQYENIITSVVISGFPKIKDVSVEKMPFSDEYYVQTEGSNFTDLAQLLEIDEYKTILDHVNLTTDLLGIEAGRAVLLQQITQVLSDAGYVDPRHIQLIVDIMTFGGMIAGNNRFSMGKSDLGFIEKCCFESVDKFLNLAAISSQTDTLSGVSSRVAFGKQINIGTGAFEVLLDIDKLQLEMCEKDNAEEDFVPNY